MAKALVAIPVDEDTARSFDGLPVADRARLEEVMANLLREATHPASRSAVEIARESGLRAQTNGLTPEILDEILSG